MPVPEYAFVKLDKLYAVMHRLSPECDWIALYTVLTRREAVEMVAVCEKAVAGKSLRAGYEFTQDRPRG